ncbi:hypothetical protein JQ615_41475 [Bradyrhizobium jicamae]|uniref:GlsB/YeaQ/YmgE family stress response membrane protein n=1 Tax=Bradyrhizobium jicamae TaxID=280332 RepID=A0ABS5FYF0_9BRAD|nr:hypothetical protein [Bradyrhizobium jicamae]MBR0801807.1 hypothetical protein [Bradyrhizobium jicamae]MBR0935768.1 hypothetical protein [Bradyrhizobium jicamae]
MKAIGWLTVLTGFLGGAVGLIVFFRHGTWKPLGINALWGGGDLQSEWIGVNKLANILGDFPIGIVILLASIVVVNLGIMVVERADR